MPISGPAAHELAQLLGRGSAGELIHEIVRTGLQALIGRRLPQLSLPIATSAQPRAVATEKAACNGDLPTP